jgi:hypothetical protein
MKRKHLLGFILLTLAFMCMPFDDADAQIKKIEYGTIAVDTLDDAETLTFAFSDVTADIYDLSWQVNLTNISGTTDAMVYLEGSNCTSCTDWAIIDTVSLDANKLSHIFIQNNYPALRARVRVVGTGTQSVEVDNHYYWRRRSH